MGHILQIGPESDLVPDKKHKKDNNSIHRLIKLRTNRTTIYLELDNSKI